MWKRREEKKERKKNEVCTCEREKEICSYVKSYQVGLILF